MSPDLPKKHNLHNFYKKDKYKNHYFFANNFIKGKQGRHTLRMQN